jgi:hypothetical protein
MSKKLPYILGVILLAMLIKGFFHEKREIKIEGAYQTDSDIPYFEVRYQAQANIPVLCQDFYLYQGESYGETKTYRYWPRTMGSHYEITIPLDENRWSFICDFQPVSVWAENRKLFDVTPENITFVRNPHTDKMALEAKLRSHNGSHYRIDFGELLLPEEQMDWYKRKKSQQKKKAKAPVKKTQKVSSRKNHLSSLVRKERLTSKRLSMISQVFKAYINVHKKTPTQKVGDALLRLEGDFTPYIGKGISDDYVQKLRKTIPYKNGYPIDAWGNRFRYKAAGNMVQASVYSTREDGLDNRKVIRRSFPVR